MTEPVRSAGDVSGNQPERPTNFLEITDAHLRTAMLRSMRLVAILAVVLALVVLFSMGWRSAALLLIGAAVAGTGLWEWQKLIALISAKLENQGTAGGARVILGFLARLAIAGAVLYVSLKSLHGSVFALLGGLALAAIALAIEASRLIRTEAPQP